jgi:acetylornithine deacetylase/succinyl-diaminopimelate desuccinylase-like protein
MCAVFLLVFAASAAAQTEAGNLGTRLAQEAAIQGALEAVKAAEPQTLEDQIRLCEVEAPPFKETKRGVLFAQMLKEVGLTNIRTDKEGNVLGELAGAQPRPHLLFAAHLDTVFPEGTDVRVKREGTLLRGPGIGDDCRGLAVLLAVARQMVKSGIKTPGTITFVGNVGEEGLGDLRGVKHLLNEELKGRVDRFVSIDGTGLGITNVAVGSLRYRVTFKGPGGHSFGAFGMSNPIHALGRAVEKISNFEVPRDPKTTFNVGRIGGGTSVNSIAFESWMEVDMRSSDAKALEAIDVKFNRAIDDAVREEDARWGKHVLSADKALVGNRPAGQTRSDAPIVQAAVSVTRTKDRPMPTTR